MSAPEKPEDRAEKLRLITETLDRMQVLGMSKVVEEWLKTVPIQNVQDLYSIVMLTGNAASSWAMLMTLKGEQVVKETPKTKDNQRFSFN